MVRAPAGFGAVFGKTGVVGGRKAHGARRSETSAECRKPESGSLETPLDEGFELALDFAHVFAVSVIGELVFTADHGQHERQGEVG